VEIVRDLSFRALRKNFSKAILDAVAHLLATGGLRAIKKGKT